MHDRHIAAFRAWRLTSPSDHMGPPQLRSSTQPTYWPLQGPLEAACKCGWWRAQTQTPPHQAPCTLKEGGGCGIYGVYTPDSMVLRGMRGEAFVLGGVLMSGVKEFHTLGMRAQFARPLFLFEHLMERSPRWDNIVGKIAANYGIPVVDPNYVLDLAAEFGELIHPEEMQDGDSPQESEHRDL